MTDYEGVDMDILPEPSEPQGMLAFDTRGGIASVTVHSDARVYVEGPAYAIWLVGQGDRVPTGIGGIMTYDGVDGTRITESIADVLRRSLEPDDPRWERTRPTFDWVTTDAAEWREQFARLVVDEPVHSPLSDIVVPTEPGLYAPFPEDPGRSRYFLNESGVWWNHRAGKQSMQLTPEQVPMIVWHNDHATVLHKIGGFVGMGFQFDRTPPFEGGPEVSG